MSFSILEVTYKNHVIFPKVIGVEMKYMVFGKCLNGRYFDSVDEAIESIENELYK